MSRLPMELTIMLDRISDYLVEHKGVPVLIAVLLAVVNFVLVLVFPFSFFATSNIFLHLAVIVGLLGILIGDALS